MQKTSVFPPPFQTSQAPAAILQRAGMIAAGMMLFATVASAQTTNVLGTTNLLVGNAAGSSSVVLGVTPATGAWTATANRSWLHLSAPNQSGMGSTNVIFSYDNNPGGTRTGTLTVGGQTVAVTQAGSGYVPASTALTTLVPDFLLTGGLGVDNSGNVYYSYYDISGAYSFQEWQVANNTSAFFQSSASPSGVTFDGAGNIYFADQGDGSTEPNLSEWVASSGTVNVLISTDMSVPYGVAVDLAGNAYVANAGNNTVQEWVAATGTVTGLLTNGLNNPEGVAVDAAGNIYIADNGNSAIKVWSPVTSNVTSIISMPNFKPQGLAVDGSGNIYFGDGQTSTVQEWVAASNTIVTLATMTDDPWVSVDKTGNVYIDVASFFACTIEELTVAYVNTTPKIEGATAGTDALPTVLPATENLNDPFTPVSDSPSWLNVTGVTNGVVSFSFAANTDPTSRTGYITVLGQATAVTQNAAGAVTPPHLVVSIPTSGTFAITFTNSPGGSFTVLSSTNAALARGS